MNRFDGSWHLCSIILEVSFLFGDNLKAARTLAIWVLLHKSCVSGGQRAFKLKCFECALLLVDFVRLKKIWGLLRLSLIVCVHFWMFGSWLRG